MTRSTAMGKFLILSKDGINDMFKNETEYSYKITQIEPSFDDDYIVEVVEKDSGIIMVPVSNRKNIFKNRRGDKE